MDGETIPVPALSHDAPGQPVPLAATPEKKKRHRRTKAELEAERKKLAPPDAAQAATDAEDLKRATVALSISFKAIGALLASKRGEHWRLKDEECDTVGAAWATVLAPYLPRVGAAMPIVSAAVITWTVVQPRIEEDGRQRAKRQLEAGPVEAAPA